MKDLKTKFIFVSGGVLSGLGKGLCVASLAFLLKNRGYTVSALKCENYLNLDSGLLNPIEHGDTFLCQDGLEADMDLGTYERIIGVEMGHRNFLTKGQIFKTIIDRERNMYYGGETVEDIPHVVDVILERMHEAAKGSDFCIVEIGGTAGEYQNVLYFEAARYLRTKYYKSVINVHTTYLPVPHHLGEPKTKPTQMSVRTLMGMGINPEFLILRSEVDLDERRKYLLGLKSGVRGENVIMAKDLKNIYELPLSFAHQEFDKKVLKHFGMKYRNQDLSGWKKIIHKSEKRKKEKVTIAIAGKYFSKNAGDFELADAYHALIESITHASWLTEKKVEFNFINTGVVDENFYKSLEKSDGIIVPIGWGSRGVEGKIEAIKFARENKIPYLGLCYGMQLACVEYARNVLKIKDADTEENNEKTKNKIIHSIPFDEKYQRIKGDGTSMRLGGYDCILKKDSLAYEIYNKHNSFKNKTKNLINERHRHRFEFNNEYRKVFENAGFIFSGTSPDNFFVEYIELSKKEHPFFIATQAHPEYKSTPLHPHPVLIEFLKASEASSKSL